MKKVFIVLFALVAALALIVLPAIAHEGREVGEYEIEFGWRAEPAYTTLLNGPEISVHNHGTEEGVEGLEDTLQIEVSFGGKSKILKLYAIFDDPGHYTADLIPTQPGDYSFHITGKIDDTDVDETFSSGDGEFSSVNPVTDIQFP